jgi:hypothetical protein
MKWESNYQKLKNYKETNGNCNVPPSYPQDESLGRWVRRQRYELKHAETTNHVVHYRRQKLQELGLILDQMQDSWMKYYQELIEFKKIYGHTMVSPYNHHSKRWTSLSLWVRNQRSQYIKHQKGITKGCFLTQDRIQKLQEIGFQWNVQEDKWHEQYRKLVEFQKKYGTTRVPTNYKEDPSLSRWVSHQRYVIRQKMKEQEKNYHPSTSLSQERIQLLNDIGFLWEIPSDQKGKSQAAANITTITNRRRRNKKKVRPSKQQQQQQQLPKQSSRQTKKMIPFPWDEI